MSRNITERETYKAIPKGGMIERYINLVRNTTDAHLAYHLPNALVILSQIAPSSVGYGLGQDIHLVIFGMVVGDSRFSRKSTAVKKARLVLNAAFPDRIGEHPASAEGLLKGIRELPRHVVYYPEMGDFFNKSKPGGSQEPMKMQYNQIYDGDPLGARLSNVKLGVVRDHHVCLLGAVATDLLEQYTTQIDWSGGFLGRQYMIYARRERNYQQFRQLDTTLFNDLVVELQDKMQRKIGPCVGMTPGAMLLWDAYSGRADLYDSAPVMTKGAVEEGKSHAIKLALLVSIDSGPAAVSDGQPWRLTPRDLISGIRLANLHTRSVFELGSRLCLDKKMRDHRAILEKIPKDGTSISKADLLDGIGLMSQELEEHTTSLIYEGKIEFGRNGGIKRLPTRNGSVEQINDDLLDVDKFLREFRQSGEAEKYGFAALIEALDDDAKNEMPLGYLNIEDKTYQSDDPRSNALSARSWAASSAASSLVSGTTEPVVLDNPGMFNTNNQSPLGSVPTLDLATPSTTPDVPVEKDWSPEDEW